MRKMLLFISIAALAVFAFGSFTLAKTKVRPEGHVLKIQLSGGAEAPGPGDTDGSGLAVLTFNHDKGELCYDITVKDIAAPTAAHVHAGAAGSSGAVKVALKKAADGTWKGCATVDKAVLSEIAKTPANFYVNVHNGEFPNGAVRGQLGK